MTNPKRIRRLKGMSRLSKLRDQTALFGGVAMEYKEEALPELKELPKRGLLEEQEETAVDIILRTIGGHPEDRAVANRMIGYMMQYPAMTTPEALVYDWLVEGQRTFQYQVGLFGGRSAKGGLVPDFLVQSDGGWSLWNVQGDYWHSATINGGKDASLFRRVIGTNVGGLNIKSVVELWESDLYNASIRDYVFQLAYYGRGMRG